MRRFQYTLPETIFLQQFSSNAVCPYPTDRTHRVKLNDIISDTYVQYFFLIYVNNLPFAVPNTTFVVEGTKNMLMRLMTLFY